MRRTRRSSARPGSGRAPSASLGLPLRRARLEGLEGPQLGPRAEVRLGGVEAQVIALDDALLDADVDGAPLDARGSTLAPVAEVAFRECVELGVVRDARLLMELELVRRLVLVADREW